jgi:hypothetical protein
MRKPKPQKHTTDPFHVSDRGSGPSVRDLHFDGSYTVVGSSGERYRVSASGDIDGDFPGFSRVQVQDVALIVRHDVTSIFQTVSHTLHFVGGGLLSYSCWSHATGISIQTKNITCCKTDEGVFIVSGTATIDL